MFLVGFIFYIMNVKNWEINKIHKYKIDKIYLSKIKNIKELKLRFRVLKKWLIINYINLF